MDPETIHQFYTMFNGKNRRRETHPFIAIAINSACITLKLSVSDQTIHKKEKQISNEFYSVSG